MSLLKRIYHIIVLLALVNFFAVVGLIGYLTAVGRLDTEGMAQMVLILRGELPATRPALCLLPRPGATTQPSGTYIFGKKTADETQLLVLERRKCELEDRRRLNQSIRFEIDRKLADFQRQQKAFSLEKEDFYAQIRQQGFEKTLEMLSSVEPEIARDLLMKGEEFEDMDVVRLLMAMDDFRAKKIVNTCQSQDELDWIRKILAQIHNLEKTMRADGTDHLSAPG
ncbi:MAG: hypothetical protein JSV03_14670 [Planctomycetota bacterium]|nr:MAG: hypothetical protein JSV03_14670 [Planctomycetota bacterium]